ncbi:YqaA family protein [Idiomarina xiamenensis]|uniref:VTT domain-containing protein n=1 Tax=Idiomarina xiamenensis 10-D-4 TaxID=740709 RepID=K2KAE7_9GAMM|nr:YqaA family protein [Idiomarina xiamenensis]EKE84788.1 hypothetical protein A10D4_04220 [Idiomarina xiamenensis 10-D-4]
MKWFSPLYDRVLLWSQHPRAVRILAMLSFAESVIFPIPPDVMLAPMSMTQPQRAWRFALLTTLMSVLGGIAGYLLGYWAYDSLVLPLVEWAGYTHKLQQVEAWFAEWGLLVVFIAGFSPIPYKLFTVTAGVMQLALLPFIAASLLSRGLRFFLVAWLMRTGGPAMAAKLRDYVDWLGWLTIIAGVLLYVLLR